MGNLTKNATQRRLTTVAEDIEYFRSGWDHSPLVADNVIIRRDARHYGVYSSKMWLVQLGGKDTAHGQLCGRNGFRGILPDELLTTASRISL